MTILPLTTNIYKLYGGLIGSPMRIYNAKRAIGFMSQRRRRLYLFAPAQTVSERPLVASFISSYCFFIHNLGQRACLFCRRAYQATTRYLREGGRRAI
jgi:hypothetical protein